MLWWSLRSLMRRVRNTNTEWEGMITPYRRIGLGLFLILVLVTATGICQIREPTCILAFQFTHSPKDKHFVNVPIKVNGRRNIRMDGDIVKEPSQTIDIDVDWTEVENEFTRLHEDLRKQIKQANECSNQIPSLVQPSGMDLVDPPEEQ